MITYSTRNGIVFMAIYKLNLRFTHELLRDVNKDNYFSFLTRYYDLLADKWREYEGLN